MVRSLATYPLLDGFRGATPKDVHALEDVVLRIASLASTHPSIVEMDCNPVGIFDRGAAVIDARIHVRTPRIEPRFVAHGSDR
jgi:acyl-CoA synthetase (NDP forming)